MLVGSGTGVAGTCVGARVGLGSGGSGVRVGGMRVISTRCGVEVRLGSDVIVLKSGVATARS